MADKIRLGIIGANIHRGWAVRSHLPAVVASPEWELTAVCTTRMESAEESRQKFGAKLAFDDYHEMLVHPDIDAVAVSLRVPAHYEPTAAALNAGKHVYTEWPLGRTTAEAQEMAQLAREKGVRNMVGLQSRANPVLLYLKDLVASGYVGEVMSCHVSRIAGGVLERESDRTWQRNKELGANTLTISCGHTIDALRFVAGDFQPCLLGGKHPGQAVVRGRYQSNGGCDFAGQHPGQRQAGRWRGRVGAHRQQPVGGKRLSHGNLWTGRDAGGILQRVAQPLRSGSARGAGR